MLRLIRCSLVWKKKKKTWLKSFKCISCPPSCSAHNRTSIFTFKLSRTAGKKGNAQLKRMVWLNRLSCVYIYIYIYCIYSVESDLLCSEVFERDFFPVQKWVSEWILTVTLPPSIKYLLLLTLYPKTMLPNEAKFLMFSVCNWRLNCYTSSS